MTGTMEGEMPDCKRTRQRLLLAPTPFATWRTRSAVFAELYAASLDAVECQGHHTGSM